MKRNICSIIAGTLLVTLQVGHLVAAGDPVGVAPATGTEAALETGVKLDPHIDSWCQGELISIDPQNQTFSVRGVNMFFATAHASMQKEVDASTKEIADPAQRKAKADEIRLAWKERLDVAAGEAPGEGKEMVFSVPTGITLTIATNQEIAGIPYLNRDGAMAAATESGAAPKSPGQKLLGAPVVGAKPADSIAAGPEQAQTPAGASQTGELKLADLRAGDRVKVGYHSRFFGNDGYALIKVEGSASTVAPVPAPAVLPESPPEKSPERGTKPIGDTKEPLK